MFSTQTPSVNAYHYFFVFMSMVYFMPLKKGVVLPLAIVKRGRATLQHIKRGSYSLNV